MISFSSMRNPPDHSLHRLLLADQDHEDSEALQEDLTIIFIIFMSRAKNQAYFSKIPIKMKKFAKTTKKGKTPLQTTGLISVFLVT